MNNRAFTISLGLAIAAVIMVYSFITSKEQEIKSKYGIDQNVLVAAKDIGELVDIHENMVQQKPMPKKFMEPGAVTDPKEVVGFIASVPIRKGEQITLNKVIAPGIKTGLSRQITPGKRAVTINVNDTTGVAKLIKPGDRVDIIATIDPPGAPRGNQISKMMLQDVPVLAVGQFVMSAAPRKDEKDDSTGKTLIRNLNTEGNFGTVTVEADPQIALQLVLLRDAASSVSLILRNNDDTDRVNLGPVTLGEMLGGDRGFRGTASRQ